ncbi:hypothetical protein MMC18_000001 [Xylographa bjoerkii]|nr:hypothetical protein [Xylographa bjoerkii]
MTNLNFSPFGNDTILPPKNWQDEPNTGGSWSIISTCLVTLGLCVWTSLHLNIPEHNGKTHQMWRKAGWLLTGLLAPELVVYVALEQRRAALRLTKEMQAIFKQAPEAKLVESNTLSQAKEKDPSTA